MRKTIRRINEFALAVKDGGLVAVALVASVLRRPMRERRGKTSLSWARDQLTAMLHHHRARTH